MNKTDNVKLMPLKIYTNREKNGVMTQVELIQPQIDSNFESKNFLIKNDNENSDFDNSKLSCKKKKFFIFTQK